MLLLLVGPCPCGPQVGHVRSHNSILSSHDQNTIAQITDGQTSWIILPCLIFVKTKMFYQSNPPNTCPHQTAHSDALYAEIPHNDINELSTSLGPIRLNKVFPVPCSTFSSEIFQPICSDLCCTSTQHCILPVRALLCNITGSSPARSFWEKNN